MVGIKGSRAAYSIQQAKRRIVKMLVVVATMFAVSWLPLYTIKLRIMFGPKPSDAEGDLLNNVLFPVAQWLGSSNSCVNPFIYCCFSRMYREGISALLGLKRADKPQLPPNFPPTNGDTGTVFARRWRKQPQISTTAL